MNDESAAASAERVDESGGHHFPSTRLLDRRPTLNQMNLLFSGVMLGWAGVFGSLVSVLFSGAILLAFLRLYQRKIVFPSDRAILAVALAFAFYLAADVISGLFHNDGMVTWRQVAKDIPFLGFAFVYARLCLSRREDVLDAVEWGAISGAFATLLVTSAELTFTAHDRAEGLAGNPGVLAVISSLVYGICLLAAARHEKRKRWVALLSALAAAAALLFTGMRALWPFLLIGPAIPLLVLRPKLHWPAVARGALVAAIPVLVVGYFAYDVVETRVDALVQSVEKVEAGEHDVSLGRRVVIWKHGLEKAEENPIIGSGPGSIKEDSSEVFGVSHYHNFLLNALVKSGVPGVLAILGLFIVPLVVMARRLRPADGTGLAGLSLLLTLQITFLLSGSVGIMLGHDIHDALFIYGTIVACFLVVGKQTLPTTPTLSHAGTASS